ncbi:MAG: LPXTG cell wall anchor domain-containing protein [Gemmataceae bacterium]
MDLGFMGEWWFMGLMVVLLLGLVGVLMFLRNKKDDE